MKRLVSEGSLIPFLRQSMRMERGLRERNTEHVMLQLHERLYRRFKRVIRHTETPRGKRIADLSALLKKAATERELRTRSSTWFKELGGLLKKSPSSRRVADVGCAWTYS